jgi:hypothetical protein
LTSLPRAGILRTGQNEGAFSTRFGVRCLLPSYRIKVPNHDDGEDLGLYEADYVPRVGETVPLLHPRVNPRKDEPFIGVVTHVDHEAYAAESGEKKGHAETVVWLAEEAGAPQLFCDCPEDGPIKWGRDERGTCENCGHKKRDAHDD